MGASQLAILLRNGVLPALCLLVAGYFLMHAFSGPSGVLALEGIRAERARLAAEEKALAARKADLEQRIGLLDPGGTDPDYADELVRRHLGVIRPDEVVVEIPGATPATDG